MKSRWKAALAFVQSRWAKISQKRGVAHLLRAGKRYSDRLGNQFAAAITYFSFLSLVPMVMVGFAVAGFTLSAKPEWLDFIKTQVSDLMGESFGGFIDQAVDQRLTVGLVGLVVALYSGLNWMGNIRDAVRAQWRPQWKQEKISTKQFLMQYVRDLGTLGGLGLAVLVSFSLTTVGTAAQDLVVGWLNLDAVSLLRPVLAIGPFAVAILADTLIFAWVYTMLPLKGNRAPRRSLIIGSFTMAIAFEILKAALTILVARMALSPSGAVFGSVIGLLLFFNLVARVFLFIAAYLATADDGYAHDRDVSTLVATDSDEISLEHDSVTE